LVFPYFSRLNYSHLQNISEVFFLNQYWLLWWVNK